MWHVRCDRAARARLKRELPDTNAKAFVDAAPNFSSQWSTEFRSIVEQKMFAIRDAWKMPGARAVLFLDADLVFTGPLVPKLQRMQERLILTPHFWPEGFEWKADRYGFFNSGFVFTRDRSFWKWWLARFRKEPEAFTDQWCLNFVSEYTNPSLAPADWNVGYWRRRDAWDLPALPARMIFFHGHLFVPPNLMNSYECGQRDFALQLFEYLSSRGRRADRRLLKYIFEHSPNDYFQHALQGDFQVLTQCDVLRAGRAIMLARSLPPQIRVICAIAGLEAEFWTKAETNDVPANLTVISYPQKSIHPTNFLRNRALEAATGRWVCFVDVDFVFQRGFWYLLFLRYEHELNAGACICPTPIWSPEGRFFKGRKDSWADSELMKYHDPPEGWDTAQPVQLFKFHDRWLPSDGFGPSFTGYDITPVIQAQRHHMHPPEPWGVLDRTKFALADEDFYGRSMDKQQLVSALVDRGIRFYFAPELFIFHNHHPATNTPKDRPERGLNVALWARRYAGKPPRFLQFASPTPSSAAVRDSAVAALGGVYGEDRLFARAQLTPPQANGSEAADETYAIADALYQQFRYIFVESEFHPAFLGYGYRIFTVIQDPVHYLIARAERENGQGHKHNAREDLLARLIESGAVRDGKLVRHFAGENGSSLQAVDHLQHLAFVVDASDPARASQVLSNVLSCRINIVMPNEISDNNGTEKLRNLAVGGYSTRYPAL